jgi:hypothetical protein
LTFLQLNPRPLETDDAAAFENLDENDEVDQILIDTILAEAERCPANNTAAVQIDDDTPESRPLAIPSNSLTGHHPQRHVELKLRIRQASKCLQALWDVIADKSFQFSHVIRVALRKGVRTRARATIAKLNHCIAHLARVYGRCRRALTRLDADNTTLDKYKILLKEDLKSSTALLNPNVPGSTRIQLSWIWRTAGDVAGETPESMRKCESQFCLSTSSLIPILVNRVQWIARNSEAKINGLQGAAAYASRKMLMWITMAHDAEAKFISINSDHYRLLDRLPQILREGSRG